MSRTRALAAFALSASLSSWGAGCSGHADTQKIPAKVTAFEGKDVVLDVRRSTFDKGQLTFEAVVGNNEEHALTGLHVEVSVLDASGAPLKTLDLSPIGARAKLTVLEPNYEVAIREVIPADKAPASVVARVTKAETYPEPADPPGAIVTTGEARGLEFASLGHFRFDAAGDAAELPFHASIGIRNTGDKRVVRVEYGLRFLDENGKETDRVPMNHVFEPPLLPRDAVVDVVRSQVRAFDEMQVEVRAVVTE